MLTQIINGMSYSLVLRWTVIGYIMLDNHNISNIFAILLPRVFAIARLGLLFNADWMLIMSSGDDVPKATIVSPIMSSEIHNLFAIWLAQVIK